MRLFARYYGKVSIETTYINKLLFFKTKTKFKIKTWLRVYLKTFFETKTKKNPAKYEFTK
jgi:hypothetical protein